MIKIKLYKNTSFGKAGEIVEVTRNVAHILIDKGQGEIYRITTPLRYSDRMMRSGK